MVIKVSEMLAGSKYSQIAEADLEERVKQLRARAKQ